MKSLISEGYKKISLTELAFHYRRQYRTNVDEQQLRKALVRSGVWGSMIKDGVLTLSASHVMPQLNKLSQNDTSKVSKEDPTK